MEESTNAGSRARMRTAGKRHCKELKLSPSRRIWAIIASLAGSVRQLVQARRVTCAATRASTTDDRAADSPEMTRVQPLRTLCLHAAETSGMTIVGDSFFQFEPVGVTGTVLLAESHLAIHTWPEHGFVTIDVYVCNYTTDNTAKAERLFASMETALQPQEARFHSIHRGGRDA